MDESDVRELLSDVSDPDLGGDVVSPGPVNSIEFEDGVARVEDGGTSDVLPGVKNVNSVASGKGGVGKSTVDVPADR